MKMKKIGKTPVILLIVMLATATLTLLPSVAADIYATGVTNYPWPMGQYDAQNTGYSSTTSAPQTNQTSWITRVESNKIRSGPAVVDGVVYVGTDANTVVALNMTMGAELWTYTVSDDVRTAPAVDNGKVFFGDRDGNLTCVSTAGVYQWHAVIGSEVRGSPTVYDNGTHDLVIAGSRGTGSGNVWCFTQAGTQCWAFQAGASGRVDGKPAVANNGTHDLVFAGSNDNKLYCIDLNTGLEVWQFDCSGDVYKGPVVDSGLVFAAQKADGGGTVYALDIDDGTSIRNYTAPDNVRGGCAVAAGKLYVAGTDNGEVWCFDIATGAVDWKKTGLTSGSWYGIPVVADGNVYFIDHGGVVYALDKDTGAEVWTYDTQASASPGADEAYCAVADGRLFVGNNDGDLFCFGPKGLYMEGSGMAIIDEYDVCENFTVEIKVENISELYSQYIGLQWDPTYLYCNSFDYVDTFIPDTAPLPGSYLDVAGSINNTAGNTTVYSRSLTGVGNAGGCNGSGTLMVAEFHVEAYCPDGTWIEFTDETQLLKYGAYQIDVPLQKFYFELNYPPAAPPVASFTQTPALGPYYVNLTDILFDASGSTPGWNGTADVAIANYTWDFGDGNVTTVTSTTITHIYASIGTFNVTLTVMCEDDATLIGEGKTSDTSDPHSKNVIAKGLGAIIDVYTEIYRFQEPPTDVIGVGPGFPADAYRPDENVTLYANLTYNGDEVQSRLVSFEVRDPFGDIVLVRTAMTNSTGTATISFRIWTICGNPEYAFGKWSVLVKTTICDEPINDTLVFDCGWIITLTDVVPVEGTYAKGEHMSFVVYGENMALHAKNFTLTVVVYDDDGVPIANTVIDTQVPAGEPCEPYEFDILVECLEVPKWAYVGPAMVYANAFYSLPSDCGVSMCPEISAPFIIEAAP